MWKPKYLHSSTEMGPSWFEETIIIRERITTIKIVAVAISF